jgi:hypothetical protein
MLVIPGRVARNSAGQEFCGAAAWWHGRQVLAVLDWGRKIDYTVRIWRERKQYIVHAMPLDVSTASWKRSLRDGSDEWDG